MKNIKNILWSHGISGDLPIVLVIIKKYEDADIIYDVLKAHEYWRIKGIITDLVIISKEGVSYTHPLWNNISEIVSNSYIRNMQNVSGGVFLLRGEILTNEEMSALKKAASLVFSDNKFKNEGKKINKFENMEFLSNTTEYANELPNLELEFFNGVGGFYEKENEYVINLDENNVTPLPWVNILANEMFGTCVTESGGGYTWQENSREFRLTPWTNDVVTDKRGETIYIEDLSTGEIFNPYILPAGFNGKYRVRYGLGYAIYEASVCGLMLKLTVFVPCRENVKISMLSIENKSNQKRNLRVAYFIDPVLSFNADGKEKFIDAKVTHERIVFENSYEEFFSEKQVMAKVLREKPRFCLDKKMFFGDQGEKNPEFLRVSIEENIENYDYPIGSIIKDIELNVNDSDELIYLFGENSEKIVDKYVDSKVCTEELSKVKDFYNNEVMKIKVKTEDKAFDLLLNGFLLYETLVSRLWARSGFYQSSGAYGYRDQLQDSLALMLINPSVTRNQILKHTSHQFAEGDVVHWWHEESESGTRTKFSDDLLWLSYVTLEYLLVTEDMSILSEEVPFIDGEALNEDEDEKYIHFSISSKKASLYEHIKLAIDHAYKLGEHGLMLMGSGDWNDGMNTVGNKGRGESVWLSWFMYEILTGFSSICRMRNEEELANVYAEYASKLAEALDNKAWDGRWYKRAFFDDGTPLGSIENDECKIDSISQSFSVISGAGAPDKVNIALSSVEDYLVDKENKIIKLLTPAFNKGRLSPGYIKRYPEGIRENGGQYTHGAIWLGIAYAMLKNDEKAYEIFEILNPINHAKTDAEIKKYQVEPYVMAADIYTNENHFGRGGWTWYTGASGWMYRFGICYLLGLKKRGNSMILDPVVPEKLGDFEVEYKFNKTVYKINVLNKIKSGVNKLTVDGVLKEGNMFDLQDDGGIHFVEYTM